MDSPTLNIGDLELNTFHTGTDLHTAAVNGDKLTIERILKQQGDSQTLNKGDKYGRTALVYTVFSDWFECADILVRHGASLLQVDSDRRSVLHWAAYLDRPKFIKLFLEHLGSNLECNFGDKDGRTALHYAAMQPNSKCLRLLLKRLILNKRNLNTTDNEQMTALHWSVFYNRLENVKLLVRDGAETTKRDGKGRCLLHMAVLNPNADSVRIVRILLKHNRHFSRQFDCEKHTSLHLAVANGNQELVRELCLAEESALNDLDHLSRSVLHYAVLKNDIELINILISAGVLPHHVDDTGASVLHYAAKNNNAQIVKRFLECFKNFEDTTDNQGRTALMWAASEGSFDVLNLMLKNLSYFNIHASEEKGLTALHFACFAGHEECVRLLIANSADITQPDKLGQTALFKACQQGHREIIDILMNRKGSQGTSRENNGHIVTFMDNDGHQANTRQEMLKDNGNMGTYLFSIQEETAVSQDTLRNSEWSHEQTESWIDGGESQKGERGNLLPVDKGAFSADYTSDSLKAEKKPTKYQTKDSTTHPRGNLSTEFSSERLPAIHELVDENGCTPLHFAAHAGHTHVCRWLLSQGVNPGKKDIQGRTALHGAAFNGHTECMALMLSQDPDLVNNRDRDGYSVLHHAAINGQLEAVKLLVSEPFQAFLNYRVKSTDWTPLDFAMAADHQDVTQFLMDNGALTIAWLQDVAANKIKKFWRSVVAQKHEATVKPLIERHKQLTKEENLKHCENEDKIRNNEVTDETSVDVIRDDVTRSDVINNNAHDDVTENTVVDDVRNSDITKRTACTVRCQGNDDVIEENGNAIHSPDGDHLGTFASLSGETEIGDNSKHILLLDACYHGDVARVQKLLHEKLDVNYRDENGCTALHLAAAHGQDAICGYLLENGAETRLRDTNGRTALHNAAIAGNTRTISLLLSHSKDFLSYLDCEHRSALHYAASMGHLDAVKLLLSEDTRVQDVCAKSTLLTPLDCAILGQHDDVIEYLISRGLQPSGLLDQAARVIQRNFCKWSKRKKITVESDGKAIKSTEKDLKSNENELKGDQIRENTGNDLKGNKTDLKNDQESMNTDYSAVKNENPSKNGQERRTLNDNYCKVKADKTHDPVNAKSSDIQTKSIDSASKTDKNSRPTDCNPIRRLSENFSEGIETDYELSKRETINREKNSKHLPESRISSRMRDNSARSTRTNLSFVQSNIEKLSRAPDSVVVASGEKDRIFQLRSNWERIALLRRKKKAALIIQKHFRKHLTSKNKADDKNAIKRCKTELEISQSNGDLRKAETDNNKNGISLRCRTSTAELHKNRTNSTSRNATEGNKPKENNVSKSNKDCLNQNNVETSYNNETTSPKRLTRQTVVNRLRTTSPEYSSSENEPSPEKRQYKSTFPLLSPRSSATSSNQSPSNPNVIQMPSNRRPNPSPSNKRVKAPLSPKSSSTSSKESPSNAMVNQLPTNRRANSSPSNRRVDVAPVLSKNELVNQWLSDGLVNGHSTDMKSTNKAKNTQVEHERSNSEPRLRKTDPSKGTRRLSSQSVSIRRESRIKNVYNSAAALSYNFALDTYHPLVSRRGRKDTAFPLTTSGRVRPNSMKRVEGGWVHTPDFAPGSAPSDS